LWHNEPRLILMKTLAQSLTAFALVTCIAAPAFAALDIPSDGSDGALNITSNTVIDLSQAVTGVWSNNNSANAGKGIYDPEKWAVVFKYSSVTIASNATVTFKNHGSRAPVVWLVNGDVTVDGELSLDGQDWFSHPVQLPEPGPGGFRGGAGIQQNLGNGAGFGPGGANDTDGVYSTERPYGNSQIVPLIGGSGGAGGNYDRWCNPGNGAAGAGAMLIASSQTIMINGYAHANGGNGYSGGCGFLAAYGSGGALRLIANEVVGAGAVEANGRYPGRIRIEAHSGSPSLAVNPPTVAAPPVPLLIWPAANAPTLRVVSIDGQNAPTDPRANVSSSGPDLTTTTSGTNRIVLETANFPVGGTVNVYIKPRNGPQSILPATFVSGDEALATWHLNTALPLSHTVVQARAVAQ